MVDLFRYIEHQFAVPTKTDAVDVTNQSSFQGSLASAADGQQPRQQVRELAEGFLSATFTSPTDDPAVLAAPLSALGSSLRALAKVDLTTVRQAVKTAFGQTAKQVVATPEFSSDLELLQNAVLAVKLVTAFATIDTVHLVAQLRAAAFLTVLANDALTVVDADTVDALLSRPVRVPHKLLAAARHPATSPRAPAPVDPAAPDQDRLAALRRERDSLASSYDALLALPPSRLEITQPDISPSATRAAAQPRVDQTDAAATAIGSTTGLASAPAAVRFGATVLESLDSAQAEALSALPTDLRVAPVTEVVDAVKHRLGQLSAELLPLEVAGPAKVFRLGAHLFTEKSIPAIPPAGLEPALPMPDFSAAMTRPVGIGNLQVVRQELIGYDAGDISHIENVLEGELLRRSTRRSEVSELTVTDETETTQTQERDQQSTDRNELATESQKESGRQSSSSSDGMTSSDYGKLVENSLTNFAQSVTAKAVDSLTQRTRQQRVSREKRTFVESAVHELDNQKGAKKVRGIYQWVDKRYSVRVLNCGKRLMYDVVVPEPAAFLVQSLKNAAQPENFQLTKPPVPSLMPASLNSSTYAYYATLYGVTGSVTPPPDEYTQTVAKAEAIDVQKELNTFGTQTHGVYIGAFSLRVPDGYKAVSGYVQHVNVSYVGTPPDHILEFFIGESNFVTYPLNANLNVSFTMAGQTGDIPVTMRSFNQVIQFGYAVGVNCQRTDKAYEQWQLKTHAAIISGYQRQLADYQDKLGRYVAAARNQLALASNYAHDPSVEQQELKRAFIFLLLGEHPSSYLPTPAPAPMPPSMALPDPAKVRDWGAVVAFFERAFEWDNLIYSFYPYYWGHPERWEELVLTQDADPQFEAFLKAGAARVVVPVRPGFEAALAHYQETGDVWMGEEIPDMFGDDYVSIIAEIKAADYAPGDEVCVEQWEVTLPTTLVLLKDDATLPSWTPTACNPPPES